MLTFPPYCAIMLVNGTPHEKGRTMENAREFEVTLRVGECVGRSVTDEFASRSHGREALEAFADVLRAYGMDVSTEYTTSGKQAKLTVRHPEAFKAESARNRNPSGRPRKPRVYGVTLEWLCTHSVEEGMQALGGVSRRTYYRRLAELREKAHK
jgi:hypothetical protein